MDFSPMISKLQTTVDIKQAIRATLEAKSIVITCPFREYANLIYNIGVTTPVDFIQGDPISTSAVASIDTVKGKVKLLEDTKVWIENAIRARGINTDELSFSQFATSVEGITAETAQIPVLSMIATETESFTNTEITIDGDLGENEKYFYKITDKIPLESELLDDSWSEFATSIETNNEAFICIALTDLEKTVKKVGLIQAIVRQRGAAGLLSIISNEGSVYNSTTLDVTPVLVEGRSYFYKEYNGETFLEEDSVILDEYTEWDGVTEITLTNDADILLIEVKDSKIYNAGIFTPVIKQLPDWYVQLYISSNPANIVGYTYLSISSQLLEGDKYYYKTGTKFDTALDLENFNDAGYVEWDGTSSVEIENGIDIFLVEVSAENKVVRGGTTVINSMLQSIEYLTITSTAGDKPNGSILTITPELEEGHKYLYRESSEYTYPSYDTVINVEDYNGYNNSTEMILENGTRILLLEVSADNKIKKAGYATINSKKPYIETLLVDSVAGEVTGYTKLTITPELDYGNRYVYVKGSTLVKYGQSVITMNRWDGTTEVGGFEDGDVITVVECTNAYEARKAGITSVKVKGVELEILTLYSRRGELGSHTIINVSEIIGEGNSYKYSFTNQLPVLYDDLTLYSRRGELGSHTIINVSEIIGEGNSYKYSFTNQLPVLYDDLTSWTDWNGMDEIPSDDNVSLCIAEVNNEKKAVGAGIVTVRAKAPDPVLESLLVTLSDTSSTGYKNISVLPTLTDGYKYKYNFTNQLPEYGDDLTSWTDWNGESSINLSTESYICIVECTTDNFARKGGIATNV